MGTGIGIIIGEWDGNSRGRQEAQQEFLAGWVIHLDAAKDKTNQLDSGAKERLKNNFQDLVRPYDLKESVNVRAGARQSFVDELSKLSPAEFKRILAETSEKNEGGLPPEYGFFSRPSRVLHRKTCFEQEKKQTIGQCFDVRIWNSDEQSAKLSELQKKVDKASGSHDSGRATDQLAEAIGKLDARQLAELLAKTNRGKQ